jgi:hypothetical protein
VRVPKQLHATTYTLTSTHKVTDNTQTSDEPFAKMMKYYLHEIPPGSPTEANTSLASTPGQDNMLSPNVLEPSASYKVASLGSGLDHMDNETPSLQTGTPLPVYPDRFASDFTSSPVPLSINNFSPTPRGSVNDIKPTSFIHGHQQCQSVHLALSREFCATLRNMVHEILPEIVARCPQSILGPMMDSRLETFAIERIDTLIREQVSDSNYQVLQENMDEFLNNVYWDNKQAEFELAEAVDQGKVEIHEVRDLAIADLEDCALQHEEDLERKIEEEKTCALEYVAEQTQVLVEKAMLLGEKGGGYKLEQPNSSRRDEQMAEPRRRSV